MNINEQQIKSVSRLSKEDRYLHFLSAIADWEEVWCIEKDLAYYNLKDKMPILYLFPHKEYAKIYADSLQGDYKLKSMDLETLMHIGQTKPNLIVGAFPTLSDTALMVEKEIFLNDLEEECQKY